MMPELDELDEIDLGQDPPTRPDKRMRVGRRNLAAAGERYRAKPTWVRQLRAIHGRASAQKLKAKVTT